MNVYFKLMRQPFLTRNLLHRRDCLPTHYRFSSAKIDFDFRTAQKMFISRSKNENAYEIQCILPKTQSNQTQKLASITLDEESKLGDFLDSLREKLKLPLRAFSMERIELSRTIMLDDLCSGSFYLADTKTGENLWLVQTKQQGEADNVQALDDSQLSFIQKNILKEYLQRVDTLNKNTSGQKMFSSATTRFSRTPVSKQQLISNLVNALPAAKNTQQELETDLIQRYQQLQQMQTQFSQIHDKLDAMSHKSVKLKMSLGLVALIGKIQCYFFNIFSLNARLFSDYVAKIVLISFTTGQFVIILGGTYQVYSWDIMEPIGYFMQLGGLICLSTLFFKFQQDYTNESMYNYMKKRSLNKLYTKYGFDNEQYLAIQKEIVDVERRLKMNVLLS